MCSQGYLAREERTWYIVNVFDDNKELIADYTLKHKLIKSKRFQCMKTFELLYTINYNGKQVTLSAISAPR